MYFNDDVGCVAHQYQFKNQNDVILAKLNFLNTEGKGRKWDPIDCL